MRNINGIDAVTKAVETYVSENRQADMLSIAGAVRRVQVDIPTCGLSNEEIADIAERIVTARSCNIAFDRHEVCKN
jgi:alcohol dehydrogenase class IV